MPRADSFGCRKLVVCAGLIEVIFVGGYLLPLRMDRLPSSLDTNLARAYGLDAVGLFLYLAVVVGLFGAYALALWFAWNAPRAFVPATIAASAVFMVTLVWAHPTYSSDILHYVATARVAFVHGENPHVVPPAAIADDPLMLLSGWREMPSPYGAGWSWLSAVPYAFSGGLETAVRGVVAFKVLAVLCALGAVGGVSLAAERIRAGTGAVAAVAFGWNPLVVIHFAGDGHNDAAMLLFLAWGVVALTAKRGTTAFVLFAAATLVKPAAGLALLMLAVSMVRGNDRRALGAGIGLSVLLAIVLYVPLWDGPRVLLPMVEEGGYFTNTPASLVRHFAAPFIGEHASERVVGGGARLILLGVALYLAWRSRETAGELSLRIGSAYLFAVALLGTWYQPWYATWPLLFLSIALATQRGWMWPVLGLTAGGLLIPVATNFAAGLTGRRAEDLVIDAFGVVLVLAPLGAAWLALRRQSFHGPEIHRPVFSPPVKTT